MKLKTRDIVYIGFICCIIRDCYIIQNNKY